MHPLGIELRDAEDMVRIFSEAQGVLGLIIFGLGLWGAAFSTLLGIITGYALVVTDISRLLFPSVGKPTENSAGRRSAQHHPVYRTCVAFWVFSPLYVFFTGVTPVGLILSINAMYAILIPILTPVLLKITNDERLMGQHKNGWLTNRILVFLVLVALFLTFRNLYDLLS